MKKSKTKSASRPLSWKRILVPIDFSENSLRALEVAVPLARDHGAKLLLLSVVENAAYAAGLETMLLATPGATMTKNTRDALLKLARKSVPAHVPVTVLTGEGRAYDVITRVAQDQRVGLIVLTSHGRSGFERALLGSTTERVVRLAPCPVFVVR